MIVLRKIDLPDKGNYGRPDNTISSILPPLMPGNRLAPPDPASYISVHARHRLTRSNVWVQAPSLDGLPCSIRYLRPPWPGFLLIQAPLAVILIIRRLVIRQIITVISVRCPEPPAVRLYNAANPVSLINRRYSTASKR